MRANLLGLFIFCALLAAIPARGQDTSQFSAGLRIEGFSLVTALDDATPFEGDAAAPTDPVESLVTYETNRTGQTVLVHVDGNLDGFELRVEPLTGFLSLRGKALTGSAGTASSVAFRAAGVLPIITGISGVGADLPVRYTLVPVGPTARAAPRDIRVTFTMD